jgi:formyl-CoA transferase
VTSCTTTRTRAQLAHDLQAAGVPCAPIKSIREVDTDPHLIQHGMIQHIHHPTRGRTPVPGCPLRLTDSPPRPLRPAPPLGESTHELTTVDTVPARH